MIKSDGTLLDLRWIKAGGGNVEYHVDAWPVPGSPLEQQQIFPTLEQPEGFPMSAGNGGGFIKDGSQVWIRSQDQKQFRIWDVETGKVLRTITTTLEENEIEKDADFDNRLWRTRRRIVNDEKDTEFLLELIDEKSTTAPVSLLMTSTTSVSLAGFSRDGTRVVTATVRAPFRVFVFHTADGKMIAEFPVPQEILPIYNSSSFRSNQLSRTGRYLLMYDSVYDLNAKPPTVFWKCPEHSFGHFATRLLGDERHIVVRLVDRYEVWDWQKNEKRITIFLLPEKQWFVFNHETHCWNNSQYANRYVDFLHRDAAGKKEWVVPNLYEYRAEWENDPSKAGLGDTAKRPAEK